MKNLLIAFFTLSCFSAAAQGTFTNLAALLTTSPATYRAGATFEVLGLNTKGDWGGPLWYTYQATPPARTSVVAVAFGGGGLYHDWQGDLRVFGITTNSVAAAAANSAAIAAARLELIDRGLPLVIPPGTLYISEPINAGGLVAVRGNGSAGTALESQLNVVTENTSAITNLAHGATVEDLHIRSRYYSWAKTATNGWAVQGAAGAAQKVRNLYIQGFFGGVNLNAFDSSIEDVEIIAKRPVLIGGGSTQSHVSRTAVRGNPFVTGLTNDTSITVASYTGGATNFTVSDASNLSIGDIIRPRSTTEYPTTITYRYFPRKITAIVGTTVTINYPWDLGFSNGTFEFVIGNGYSAFETTTEMVMSSVNAEWGSWSHIFTPNSGPTASSTINGIHIEGWTLDSAGNNYILNGLNTAVDVSHMDIANLTAFASTGIAVFDPATRGRIGALHVRDFDLRNSIPFYVIRELTQTYGESVVVEEFFNAGADVQRLTADGNQYRNAVADYKIGVGGELVRVEGSGLGKATWFVTGPNPTTGNYVAGDDIVTPTNGVQTVITTGSFRTPAGSNRVYQGSARLIVDATARGVLGRRTPVTVSGRQLVVKDQLRSSPDETTLASAVAVGDRMLPVVSASGFQQGDPVIVVSGATFNDGTIARVAGNYIWLTQPLTNAFSSGATVLSTMGLYEASPVAQTNFVALAFTAPTFSDFRSADGKLTAGSSLASAGLVVVGGASGLPIVELRRPGVGTNAILANGGLLRFRNQADSRDMFSLSADTNAAQQYITIGSSTAQTTPRDGIIQGEAASGTNVGGTDLIVRPGPGTGNATSPVFTVQIPVAGASGASQQSHLPRLQVDGHTTTNETAVLLTVSGLTPVRLKRHAATGFLYIDPLNDPVLGSNTIGNFIANITNGVGVTVTGSGGEGVTVTVAHNLEEGAGITLTTNGNKLRLSAVTGSSATNGTPVSFEGTGPLTVLNVIDSADLDFTLSSGTNFTAVYKADSVELGAVTTGNYISTIAGTANEITVTGSGAESASVTLSLPTSIDLGGKTSFEIPNAASPITTLFGQIAGKNNAWGASRGTIQMTDGTETVYVIALRGSDTPVAGQVPTFNADGTWTAETPAAVASSYIVSSTTAVEIVNSDITTLLFDYTVPGGTLSANGDELEIWIPITYTMYTGQVNAFEANLNICYGATGETSMTYVAPTGLSFISTTYGGYIRCRVKRWTSTTYTSITEFVLGSDDSADKTPLVMNTQHKHAISLDSDWSAGVRFALPVTLGDANTLHSMKALGYTIRKVR